MSNGGPKIPGRTPAFTPPTPGGAPPSGGSGLGAVPGGGRAGFLPRLPGGINIGDVFDRFIAPSLLTILLGTQRPSKRFGERVGTRAIPLGAAPTPSPVPPPQPQPPTGPGSPPPGSPGSQLPREGQFPRGRPPANDPIFRRGILRRIAGRVVGGIPGIVGAIVLDQILDELERQASQEREREREADAEAARRRQRRQFPDEIREIVIPGVEGAPVEAPEIPRVPRPARLPLPLPVPLPLPTPSRPVVPVPVPLPESVPGTVPAPSPPAQPRRIATPSPLRFLPAALPFAFPSSSPRPFAVPGGETIPVGDILPDLTPGQRTGLRSTQVGRLTSNVISPTAAEAQSQKCEAVKRRRRRKGKCREGFFREFPGRTEFVTWRERNCGEQGIREAVRIFQ